MMKTSGIRKALRYFIKKNTPKDNDIIDKNKSKTMVYVKESKKNKNY